MPRQTWSGLSQERSPFTTADTSIRITAIATSLVSLIAIAIGTHMRVGDPIYILSQCQTANTGSARDGDSALPGSRITETGPLELRSPAVRLTRPELVRRDKLQAGRAGFTPPSAHHQETYGSPDPPTGAFLCLAGTDRLSRRLNGQTPTAACPSAAECAFARGAEGRLRMDASRTQPRFTPGLLFGLERWRSSRARLGQPSGTGIAHGAVGAQVPVDRKWSRPVDGGPMVGAPGLFRVGTERIHRR